MTVEGNGVSGSKGRPAAAMSGQTSASIVAVILAAGASTRMRGHKQLLRWQGRTLLEHAIEQAAALPLADVVVISGSESERVAALCTAHQVRCLFNPQHAEGQIASLRHGLASLAAEPVDAALIMLCDQPLIPPAHYAALLSAYQAHGLSATAYAAGAGMPLVLPKTLFADVLALPDGVAPRSLIQARLASGACLACAEAALDIDTDADYRALLRN